MAEDSTDDSQKTEDASFRKLDEARKKGQVPQSREVTNWFVISGAAASMMIFAPAIGAAMQRTMARFVEQAPVMRLDGAARAAIYASLGDVAAALAPPLRLMIVV